MIRVTIRITMIAPIEIAVYIVLLTSVRGKQLVHLYFTSMSSNDNSIAVTILSMDSKWLNEEGNKLGQS